MILRAGLLSLSLLVASRVLGLMRESALAAAFGTSGMGDIAVLMLTLPDLVAGLMAGGALSYVLLPLWAKTSPSQQNRVQRALAFWLVGVGTVLGLLLWLLREPAVAGLASGLSFGLRDLGDKALLWSAVCVPMALLASLWASRLQHEKDFAGMYGANLVINGVLVLVLVLLTVMGMGRDQRSDPVDMTWLGAGLVLAMSLRLLWLHLRLPRTTPVNAGELRLSASGRLPAAPVWLWALGAAGLPLTLPFLARSLASQGGEGALATFNYAWKLVELPLVLAIQLVASLSFPLITQAFAQDDSEEQEASESVRLHRNSALAVRSALVLAWTLASAAAAGLLVAAPAVAQLLFGWGRMSPQALVHVAQWGMVGAWGLLPQAVSAVVFTVLATQGRLHFAVASYALALGVVLVAGVQLQGDGAALMMTMNLAYSGVAVLSLATLGLKRLGWLPVKSMLASGAALALIAWGAQAAPLASLGLGALLSCGAAAAVCVLVLTWLVGPDLRAALRMGAQR